MIYVVLAFLAISLLLYVLLAGADFGAGIIELFSSKENQAINKKTVYQVMGPVWEANHIWIIILIVILWIAFPHYYNILVLALHIPLTLVLLGITLRGVAFVFRYYDAYKDSSQILYDWMFKTSSLVTPIFLGLTMGGVVSGDIINPSQMENHSFLEVYVHSWFNVFSILTGFFYAALCAFLASVFLIGEVDDTSKSMYMRKASIATIIVVSLGFITLAYGYLSGIAFVVDFIGNIWSISAIIVSGILLFPLWKSIKSGRRIISRALAGIQIFFILFAATITHFPNILFTTTGSISIYEQPVPDSVMNVLGISLLVGGVLIIPGLFHLLKSFKLIKLLER
ncbi:cytochrome d ubiquinol oxidase subunit II [uncultured Maribacter sp.]|uniref:cytochrome d ubiquinol oxidase subunit II n=1 Tax=uncultured Maribacter sp. TaxID=431308 RepID=UPI00260E06C7|nr:cytochrome d ubiquinol oxidase subunit II [uncultured Maribacter sp.]